MESKKEEVVQGEEGRRKGEGEEEEPLPSTSRSLYRHHPVLLSNFLAQTEALMLGDNGRSCWWWQGSDKEDREDRGGSQS